MLPVLYQIKVGIPGMDPVFLERGLVCIKVWGIRFADFI